MRILASLWIVLSIFACSGTETGNPPLTETSDIIVPSQGGTLHLSDAAITIPPDSLEHPTPLRIYLRRIDAAIPEGFIGYSAMYEIVPDVTFNPATPASVTLQVSNVTQKTALYTAPTLDDRFESRGGQASGMKFTATLVRSGVIFVGEPKPSASAGPEPEPEPVALPALQCASDVIDDTPSTGHGVAIASFEDTLVALYTELVSPLNDLIHYATKTGSGPWSHQLIDGIPEGVLSHIDLDLDAEGNVHACYHVDDVNQGFPVTYLTNKTGWSTEVVGPQAQTNVPMCDIAVDDTGVYLTYRREKPPEAPFETFELVTNATGPWTSEEIPADRNPRSADLLRHQGTTYVAHATNRVNFEGWDLGVLLKADEDWSATLALDKTSSPLDGDYDVNRISLAIDSEGFLHMGFMNLSEETINYATNKSGSWLITTIASIDAIKSGSTDIAIDANDAVHLAYVANRDLHYATNKHGQWQTILASDDAGVGAQMAMTLDTHGNVHIIFEDTRDTETLLDSVVTHTQCE
jgi:hypothetical protein